MDSRAKSRSRDLRSLFLLDGGVSARVDCSLWEPSRIITIIFEVRVLFMHVTADVVDPS